MKKNTFYVEKTNYQSPLPSFKLTWHNGEEQTSIPVSMHGAIKLGETFKSFGYAEQSKSIKFVKGLSY
tara:strand:- start:406 stop:609 length:204 start_codon:yes stop_codon:yes gene_type:complete